MGNISKGAGNLPFQIYFDNAATTPLLPEALECLTETSRDIYGNSSSAHTIGKRSSAILNESKATFAELFGVPPEHVVFTSGGTESNNLAVWGALGGIVNVFHWLKSPRARDEQILTSVVEHAATQKIFEQFDLLGANVSWLGVNSECLIDSNTLSNSLANNQRVRILSLHHVQNEIGAVQPIRQIADQVREHSPEALVHIDAIQSFAKIPVDLEALNVDLVSVSGHKIGGPKGIGALVLGRRFADRKPKLGTILAGSGQQDGLRPGTVPVPLIASFATAAKLGISRLENQRRTLETLRNRLAEKLNGIATVNGPSDLSFNSPFRAPQTLNFSLTPVQASSVVEVLSAKGICISAGSACQSSGSRGSEVLLRMGLGASRAQSALRASFSVKNSVEEVDILAEALNECLRIGH